MPDFKLDRSAFKGQTIMEASDHRAIDHNMHWKERLLVAAYLISVAYKYDPANPPVMNRKIFSAKSIHA